MEENTVMQDKMLRWLMLCACLAAWATPALADDDEEGSKTQSMHQLAAHPPIPSAHKDFSQFRYRPVGDKVVEQADANRLLFWTPQGTPDGYAERLGNAIVYYDRTGKAIRVQQLAMPTDE
ncbi:hypothetical protein AA13595_1640 [Gluconacetobacter johannae DSM 13595]|uniref:Uncharacterized protein n=1 Tax=Gluconacetobacter johannae TaxID=112140 RepID=A0A7W4P4Y6_9PROT|nr:hypothetical protein [Gluconacetobacter johannae]MBB2174315.1 hypothetical protein [Gluconacetobacter johannae]GBQ85359.1 hypothetical protein AA13595_1640 [Gluconacetobacter johannae DSM 13595]